MLTPKVRPAGDGLPVAAHGHGPLVGPDDFADCGLCGAGPSGRCELPDNEDTCPHGCSPER